jgi:predicted Zn-dependent peptidase
MVTQQLATAAGRPINREEREGLCVYWTDTGGPFRAMVAFRVGFADEPLPLRGISHLVEHLAITPKRRLYTFNGWAGMTNTGFWAEGRVEEALEYLEEVCRLLSAPPVDRLEAELRILRTESSGRGTSLVHALIAARCGVRGYGAAASDELALNHVDAETVRNWSERQFVAENAVVILSGPPPDDFRLELGHGDRAPLPKPTQIAGLELPTCIAAGAGAVAAGFVVDRGPATGVALATLAERLTARLRHELGLSYAVWTDYEPLGDHQAHVTISADCTEDGVEQVTDAMLTALDELAADGVDEQSVAHEVERFQRMLDTPQDALDWYATGELLGVAPEEMVATVATTARVTSQEITAVLTNGVESMLMLIPAGHTPRPRFRPYPTWSERAVTGRVVRPGGLVARLLSRKGGLVVGEEGISGLWGDGAITTVRWTECEAVLIFPDGTVVVMGCDGDRIAVPVPVFGAARVTDIRREIERHVPGDRLVPMPAD